MESKSKQQAKKKHSGYRQGSGRKPKYGTKTVVMRVSQDRVQEVHNLIGGSGLESVTESNVEPIEDIRRIIERWGELLKSKSPKKQMCSLEKMN